MLHVRISVLFLCVLAAAFAQDTMIGFVPELSASCSSSLSTLLDAMAPYSSCASNVSAVVTDSSAFGVCSSGRNGVNCFDPDSVIGNSYSSKYLVPVYRLPTVLTTCQLCTSSSGMISGCSNVLEAIVDATYTSTIDFDAFGITNSADIDSINAAASNVNANCSNSQDSASLQVLRYQSEVLCTSQDTFNMTLATGGNIQGVLDMRSLFQCGTCAVLPCFPGQLCDGSGEAGMCPEGYYCPTTSEKIECPEGYFCPEGTVDPIECTGNAADSCQKGAGREVVWVPLLISLLLLSAIIAAPYAYHVWLEQLKHERTNPMRSPSKMFKSIPLQDEMSFSTLSSPVSIKFDDVTLVTGKTTRISGVSGYIRPGKFTAIIGGSGAGKTSLMNVILGREDKTSGEVAYLSDDLAGKIPSALLPRIVAFVPQNDVYLREMTVYELIAHSARWRLQTSLSKAQVEQRIEEVLEQLQLSHLRDVQIHNSQINHKGGSSLSPGDKKKVNIALELVAGPNVLFLDEPTTGIDSSSALNVATIVRNLARTGLTCVAVIHQPRAEIFSLIDDMVILIRGGHVAYQGPTEYVMEYFMMFGLKPPHDKANKTDFLIDMVSKAPPSSLLSKPALAVEHNSDGRSLATAESAAPNNNSDDGAEVLAAAEATPAVSGTLSWSDLWQKHGEEFLQRMEAKHHPDHVDELVAVSNSAQRAEAQRSRRKEDANASQKTFVPLDVPRPGFLQQLWLSCVRGIQQHFKNGVYLNDLIVHTLGGIIMGVATCGGPLVVGLIPPIYQGSCPPGAEVRCNVWVRFQVGPATFLITMILGAITIPIAVRTFGREKEVFAREAAVGANTLAYFLGKLLSDLPFLVVNCFMYLTPIIAIAPWQSPPGQMYAILLCIAICVLSLGYGLSLLLNDPDDAVLTGVIFAILLNLFSGFVPTIGDGPIGQIMYTHWAARAITATELIDGQDLSVADFDQIVPDEWQKPDYGTDLGNMLIIALVLFLCSFGLLYRNNRQTGKLG